MYTFRALSPEGLGITSGEGGAVRFRRPSAWRRGTALLLALGLGLALVSPSQGAQITPEGAAAPTVEGGQPAVLPEGLVRYRLVPGATEARYRIGVLVLGGVATESTCRSPLLSGDIAVAPDGSIVSELSRLVLDQRALRCDPPLRDHVVQSTLETALYPNAELMVRQAPGLPIPLAPMAQTSLKLLGDQSVHGVTRPVEYDAVATIGEQDLQGRAATLLRMSDYNIRAPRIGPLLSVDDSMRVEFEFRAIKLEAPVASAGN